MTNAELQEAINGCNATLGELTQAGDGDSMQGRLLRGHLRELLREQRVRLPMEWTEIGAGPPPEKRPA